MLLRVLQYLSKLYNTYQSYYRENNKEWSEFVSKDLKEMRSALREENLIVWRDIVL